MTSNDIDELFEQAEQDAAAFVEARRIKLVGMYELGAVGEDEL